MKPLSCPLCGHESLVVSGTDIRCDHCMVFRRRLHAHERLQAWAQGRVWWWRALVLVGAALLCVRYAQDSAFAMDRLANPIHLFDLGIHELGHILFIPLGSFMAILGGSVFQCLFPLLWFGALLWRQWYFASSLMLFWCGINIVDVSVYAADAGQRLLPLATLSSNYDDAHDWYQILSRTDALDQAVQIAQHLHILGILLMTAGICFGGIVTFIIARCGTDRPDQVLYGG